MPYIESSFTGNKFILNGHLETIIPSLFRKVHIIYKRERLNLADGDFIDLDWIKQEHKKLVVLFHGLEGSSQSQYIKGFAKYFSERHYDICAVNFRSCSGEPNLLMKSYHSGVTADIQEVISHIHLHTSYTSINLIGFSLGGNVLLKYLGDGIFEHDLEIKAAAAFSVPIDLAGAAIKLARFSNKLYMRQFLKTMTRKLEMKSLQFNGSINIKKLQKITTFEEWDTMFTAPINGFTDAADYYAKCNSKQFLKNIKIPTLLVNALNDPFLSQSCYPSPFLETGQNLFFESPAGGGHVGFMKGLPHENYYSEERAFQFFSQYN
ncbi:MAG: alpha/beta fold hydrolase [Bacteroidia bacterium]|nr:alpha/beta fold hydrolase [Bacteroidia bacterium]